MLTLIGLTEADARLYSTIAAIGPSTVAELSRRAGIQRTSAYYMLDKLGRLGLVHTTYRNGKRPQYFAEPPDRLLKVYDKRLAKAQQERSALKTHVTDLQRQYAVTAISPKVQFDRGVFGIKRVMEEAMSGKYQEVLNIMSLDTMLQMVGIAWFQKLIKKQIENKVLVKVLRVAERMNRHAELSRIDPDSSNQWRQRRVLPRSLDYSMTLWIYGDTFSFFSSQQESYAMSVRSAELADAQRKTFMYFWNVAKPIDTT